MYDNYSESGLGLLARFAANEVEVMRTSVAAATSAALKSKKRKKSPDGKNVVFNLYLQRMNM